jgi:hypothetical protein
MISMIVGLALLLLSLVAFSFALPRGGKVAGFVGSPWEGYIVIVMVLGICGGVMLAVAGVVQLFS